MPITSIQPIANFSAIVPATAVSPQEEVSVAVDFVSTPTSSTVVTIGETQPLFGPLFDSSGNLVTPGTTAQTAESQALANELHAALNAGSASTGFDNLSITLNVSNTTNVTLNAELQALAFGTGLLNTSGLADANLKNATRAGSNDFTGLLSSDIALAIAGIGTGSGANTANGQLSANAIAVTPTTTPPTTATTTGAAVAAPTATATPAVATPAVVTPAVAAPAIAAPAVAAPAVVTPAIATPATLGPAIAGTGLGTTAATATAATLAGTSPPTPAEVLRQLVSDVTGRAVANLVDPGFASTSASMFVAAAVFRAGNSLPLNTADTAGAPPPEVTAAQPARAV